MPITVLGFDGGAFAQYHAEGMPERFLRVYTKLVFSGNYPAGGDTLDLTNAGGTPTSPNTVPAAVAGGVVDLDVIARSSAAGGLAAGGGLYVVIAPNANAPLKFSDLATLKMKIFTSGNTELGAGAYPASVTGDIVTVEVVYVR